MEKHKNKKVPIKEKIIKIIFVIVLTSICFAWSTKMPYKYGPDEEMKMVVCKYIYKNSKLPTGKEQENRDRYWGISYSFMPIFDYIVGGICMKAVSTVSSEDNALLVAARLPSVLSYMGTLIIAIFISNNLFKRKTLRWLFLILIGCLPQFMFIGSYINNDCFAVFCSAIIIYAWILGLKNNWNKKSCIYLGIGIGLCAMSYYNAYGYILTSIIIFIVSYIKNQKENIFKKKFWLKVLTVFIIAFSIAGWWFIRSAILNNGDFLGLVTIDKYAEEYAEEDYKPSNRVTPEKQGQSLLKMLFCDNWIWQTVTSSIAVFGNMTDMYHIQYYIVYIIVFLSGILGAILYYIRNRKRDRNTNRKILEVMFGINILIPIILSVYYSYYSDFQAQGRYIMPGLIPCMYFIAKGFGYLSDRFIVNMKIKNISEITLAVALCISGITSVILKIQF